MSRSLLTLAALAAAAPAWAGSGPEVMVSLADRQAMPGAHGSVALAVRFTPDGAVQQCDVQGGDARLGEASCRLLRERGWTGDSKSGRKKGVESVRFNWSPPEPRAGMFDGGAAMISPQSWYRFSDYPPEALQKRISGSTLMDVAVSDRGAVTGCAVVEGSGSASLDYTSCRIIRERARFFPAGDGHGGRKATTVRTRMNWSVS